VLQWFRKKVRTVGEAPREAAPSERQEEERPRAVSAEAAPAEGEAKPRRRRGSRGGRGRKKTGAGAENTSASRAEASESKPKADDGPKPDEKSKDGRRRRTSTRRGSTSHGRVKLPDLKKEILVSVDVGEQRVAVLEDGKAAEVYLERPGRRSIAGNVYKGVVDNVLPGMEASFVEIGLEKNGFLYVDEIVVPELEGKKHGRKIQDLVQRGQEVLVQAVKDPMGTKGARLTTEISLPGRFLVYTPFGEGVGISRRLEDAERDRLKVITKGLDIGEGGIIVRTAAEGATQEELEGDLALLRKLWETIQGKASRTKAPALIYQESELPLRIVRDLFNREYERVVVDHERTYRRIVGYLRRTSKDLVERVELYTGKERLMEKAGVEAAVQSTLNRRVDLPSGGYLIFDYAEAFTVVDVNTGRFVGARGKTSGARLEDTITKNNLEAVEEVVRQLRLRDIGGIIVIDFIDMANPKNRELVEEALRRELERDRTKTYVVEISPLGLVEMTRQNVTDGPREILTVKCTTCGGDGIVVSDETRAIDIERELRRQVAASRSQAFKIELSRRVAALVAGPGASRLEALEAETGRRFFFESPEDAPSDHFHVVARGPVVRLQPKSLPVAPGDELELKLEGVDPELPGHAVARVNGYAVAVAIGKERLGQTVKVRIQRAMSGVGFAAVANVALAEAPAEAGVELEVGEEEHAPAETKRRTTRPRRAAVPKDEPADVEAEEPVEEAGDAEVEGAEPSGATDAPEASEERPKKRTRRGSRGGRGRKKKAPLAEGEAGADGTEPQPTEAVAEPQPTEASAERPVEEGTETPTEAVADGEEVGGGDSDGTDGEKPKKKTRRGSRGGRNRRKKTPVEQPLESEPAGESPLVTSEQ
jgi:ribonuclease G